VCPESQVPKSRTTLSRHLISINQAADRLGVNPRTIRRMVSRGQLTAYRVGNKIVRLDSDDVDALPHRIPTAPGDFDDAA
jgi:excisionase family DNA binding protein